MSDISRSAFDGVYSFFGLHRDGESSGGGGREMPGSLSFSATMLNEAVSSSATSRHTDRCEVLDAVGKVSPTQPSAWVSAESAESVILSRQRGGLLDSEGVDVITASRGVIARPLATGMSRFPRNRLGFAISHQHGRTGCLMATNDPS